MRACLVDGEGRVQVLEATQRRAAAARHKLEQAALFLLQRVREKTEAAARLALVTTLQQVALLLLQEASQRPAGHGGNQCKVRQHMMRCQGNIRLVCAPSQV